MALEIVAAKDLNHAFEIASMPPKKTTGHLVVSESEVIGDFLYDTRKELTNYTCYYQFDPYREIQLEADQVPVSPCIEKTRSVSATTTPRHGGH